MNYSNKNIKNNQSYFAKVEIVRILLFHFLVDLLPKIVVRKKFRFLRIHKKHLKESRKPRPQGKFAKVKIKIKKRSHTLYCTFGLYSRLKYVRHKSPNYCLRTKCIFIPKYVHHKLCVTSGMRPM